MHDSCLLQRFSGTIKSKWVIATFSTLMKKLKYVSSSSNHPKILRIPEMNDYHIHICKICHRIKFSNIIFQDILTSELRSSMWTNVLNENVFLTTFVENSYREDKMML